MYTIRATCLEQSTLTKRVPDRIISASDGPHVLRHVCSEDPVTPRIDIERDKAQWDRTN